jgi:hypothetical protein
MDGNNEQPGTARLTRFDGLVAGALCLPVPGYWALTATLFPLVEYRDWIARGPVRVTPRDLFIGYFLRREPRGIVFSILYAESSGTWCGLSLPCLNGTSLAPLLVAAPLLYLIARRLGQSRAWGAFAVLCWIGSAAVFDALLWQATILDRLALALSLGTLAWLTVAERAGPLLGNLVGFALVNVAYNCKESAWFLLPTLLSWAVLMPERARWQARAIVRRLGTIVLPLGYAGLRTVRYWQWLRSSGVDPEWKRHVAAGAPAFNLKVYASVLADLPTRSWSVVVVLALLVAALVVVSLRRGDAAERRAVLFSWSAFACAFVVPLATETAAPYYMYLPGALFWLAVGASLSTLGGAPLRRWRAAPLLIVLAALVKAGVAGERALPQLRDQDLEAANLRQSVARIGEQIAPTLPDRLTVVYSSVARPPFRFQLMGDPHALWRWLGAAAGFAPPGEIRVLRDNDPRAGAPLGAREARLAVDEQARLVRVEVGQRR